MIHWPFSERWAWCVARSHCLYCRLDERWNGLRKWIKVERGRINYERNESKAFTGCFDSQDAFRLQSYWFYCSVSEEWARVVSFWASIREYFKDECVGCVLLAHSSPPLCCRERWVRLSLRIKPAGNFAQIARNLNEGKKNTSSRPLWIKQLNFAAIKGFNLICGSLDWEANMKLYFT